MAWQRRFSPRFTGGRSRFRRRGGETLPLKVLAVVIVLVVLAGLGGLFLFVNQSRKLCKVLLWDGTGLCFFQKRLEKGTFAKLWRDDGEVVRLTASELALYIEGCTLVGKYALSPVVVERKSRKRCTNPVFSWRALDASVEA